ncbi:MAG: class I SAM-dependent methyltransferase [Acidimicrobiales bacterium]
MPDDLVRSAYQDEQIAEQYDETRFASIRGRAGSDRDVSLVARAIGELAGAPTSILDVACGSGRVTEPLTDRFPSSTVVGLDGSLQMLGTASAKAGLRSRSFVQADATALPFVADAFDVVTSVRFLGHLDEDSSRRFFAELARVARSLVVVDVSVTSRVVDFRRRLERRLKGSYLGFQEEWTWRTFGSADLADILAEAGLEQISLRRKMVGWSDARVLAARPR